MTVEVRNQLRIGQMERSAGEEVVLRDDLTGPLQETALRIHSRLGYLKAKVASPVSSEEGSLEVDEELGKGSCEDLSSVRSDPGTVGRGSETGQDSGDFLGIVWLNAVEVVLCAVFHFTSNSWRETAFREGWQERVAMESDSAENIGGARGGHGEVGQGEYEVVVEGVVVWSGQGSRR